MHTNTQRQLILVVDDTPANIDVLGNILREHYSIKVAISGETALRIAQAQPKPDLILLDIMMPGMDGYQVCQQLKANPTTSEIPVIFVTAKDDVADEEHGFQLGAVDYITKPVSPSIVEARVRTHLALYSQNRELAHQVKNQTQELLQTRLQIIQRLGRAAEYRDNETGYHVIRMSHYARLIAQEYGGNPDWVETLFYAAPMHDVGKIGVPDAILLKPGKLDAEEWVLMQKHAEFGAEIIGDEDNSLIRMSRIIALTHHEKWDGTGYPNQLAGEEIPLEGRITAIADVFDALTSPRPYKKAWPDEKAIAYIEENAGQHFDPNLVPIFFRILDQILAIKQQYSDEKPK